MARQRISYVPLDKMDAGNEQEADRAAESKFSDVAEEVVGAERHAASVAGVSVRNERRAQRMLE